VYPCGERPDIVATCELDLLLSTESPEAVEIVDYKSGHKAWGVTAINESFQLGCFQPLLVMLNYPKAHEVHVRVHNTRVNDTSAAMVYKRGRWMANAMARVKAAIDLAAAYMDHKSVEDVPEAAAEAPEIAADPLGYLKHRIAAAARLDAMDKALKEYVHEHGDIVDQQTGQAFGVEARPAYRTPTPKAYMRPKQKGTPDGEAGAEE
jgi:hypothetical protein